jgi:NitT/TauT family transport system permease protein
MTMPLLRHHRTLVVALAFLAAAIGLWQLLVPAFGVPPYVLPTPAEIVKAAVESHEVLLTGLEKTALGAFTGFAAGNLAGVVAAVAMASSLTASRVILPMAVAIRSIPIIALTPFLTLLLGRGLVTVMTISGLIVFFPTLVNGLLGLRSSEAAALELMRVLNAPWWDVFWRVRLPTALPALFAAFRVAAASCVLGALVAEWVASGSGLGQVILQSGVQFEVPLMWSGVVVSTLLAILAFGLVSWAEKRIVSWQPQT